MNSEKLRDGADAKNPITVCGLLRAYVDTTQPMPKRRVLDHNAEGQARKLTWLEIVWIVMLFLLVVLLFAIPTLLGWDAPNT